MDDWLVMPAQIVGTSLNVRSNGASFRLAFEISALQVSDVVKAFGLGKTGVMLEWRSEEDLEWRVLSAGATFAPGSLSPDADGYIHCRVRFVLPAEEIIQAVGPIAASIAYNTPKGKIRIKSLMEPLFPEDK